jgi:hypothetical protein
MTWRAWCLALVSLLPSLNGVAAPAPLPRTHLPAAEAVFDAKDRDRARMVAAYLRSSLFAETLAESADVADHLTNLPSDEDRRDWVRSRLRVTADGELIRVRLEHPSSALATLAKLTDRLVAVDLSVDEKRRSFRLREAKASRHEYETWVKYVRQGYYKLSAEELEEKAAATGRYEIVAEPLKLYGTPRDVGRGR